MRRLRARTSVLSCTTAVLLSLGLAADETLPVPDRPGLDNEAEFVVERLVDERTLVARSGSGDQITIRLLGVARPREDEQRARLTSFLEQMLIGERVHLLEELEQEDAPRAADQGDEPEAESGPDSETGHGTPPRRYVYRCPDNLLVNLEIIRQGYAPLAAQPDFALRKTFRAHERHARQLQRGIWQPRAPQGVARATVSPSAPAAKEGASKSDDSTVFVTASGSRYHKSGCRHLSADARAMPLSQARGKYSPCKVCKPPE